MAERKRNTTGLKATLRTSNRQGKLGILQWHVEHSPLAVVVWDRDGRIQYWSRRAEEVFGWSAEEICGRTWADWRFVHDADQEDVERRIARLYRGEEQYNISENRNYTRTGEVRYCRWFNSALPGEDGTVETILSQIDDITHYKIDEFRYRGVFENMPDGLAVYRWDEDVNGFVFSDFNPSAERITKVTKADVVGRPLLECFPHMDRFGLVGTLQHVMLSGEPVDLPPRWYEDEQRQGWRENRVYRLSSGEVTAIFADVTRRMQTEEELRRAMSRAEEASRAKSEFLANMSHEVRTPLNGVVGLLQLLETTGLAPEQSEYVRTALRSSLRLTRLLGDILDISRIEAGRLSVTREPVRLRELFRSIRELLLPTAEKKGVGLELHIHPETPDLVMGDPVRLQQVLFNLTGNAVKFSNSGTVRLEVSPLETTEQRTRLLFVISDSGIGIPEQALETLFQPFTQVERDFNRRFEGAGLGLSIVKRLLDLMGGHVAVDSEPDRGTDVYVSLSLDVPDIQAEAAATGSESQPVSAEGMDLRGLRVLLAEDDAVNRIAVTRLLERADIRVQSVVDGEQCLEYLRRHTGPKPDVLLLDIQMPRLDGWDTLRTIRSELRRDLARLPVVALTAHAMRGDQEKLLQHGFDGYLSKPVLLSNLLQEIRRVLALGAGGQADH